MSKPMSGSASNLVASSPRVPQVRSLEEVKASLSSLVSKLSENTSGKTKLALLNQLLDLSSSLPPNSKLSSFYPITSFVKSLRPLIAYRSRALRITALRVFRLYLRESEMIQLMLDMNMHYLIAWSLEKEKQPDRERMQALKLIRKIVEVDCSLLPRAMVQALVSVAEAKEDPLSRTCLNVLVDAAIRNPKIVSLSNGIRTLCFSVVDLIPLNEGIQDALITAILYLLGDQSTRKYVNSNDLRLIVSPLTDVYNLEGGDKVERWRVAKRAVVMMLKSWSGLFALASDSIGLKSIVEALRQPALELNEIVLDALFEIFRLSIPKHDPFTQSKKKTDNSTATELTAEQLPRVRNVRHNAIDNFIAILLYAFINNGVVQALIDLGNEMRNESKEDTEGTTATKQLLALRTTVLIGELLYLSNTHLPTTQCARLQTLPILVNQAVSFTLDPRLRSRASTMITYLYQYSHIKGSSQTETVIPATGPQKWRKRGKGRRLARIEEVKMKMDYKMDDATFQQKLRETNVLVTKDYQRWKWDLIADLLRGPLTNPAHVNAAFKTKFIKRLLSFLRPSNGLFANIPLNQNNLKYARIACQLLEVLVVADVGQACLNDNRLVPQIADHLKIEVELAQTNEKAAKPQKPGKDKDNRLLGKERILKTMAREYFTLIGTLSSSTVGLDILNKHKVFEQLSPMSVLPGRDDLSHPIMTSLDYNMPGAARILLAKSLTATSKVVRYLATRHLGFLLRSGATAFPDWGVMFLVKQLSDEHGKVVIEALQVLDEACDDIECLESLIARRPNLMNLGKEGKGKEIMIRFLSRNSGFQYLYNETNLIKTELQLWRESEFINYALGVEKNLQSTLQASWKQKPNNDEAVYLPPHFYGELAQTVKGCEVLKQSGHFPEFVVILKNEASPPVQRRAALWVIGHVGKSTTGLDFLTEADIIPYIANLAIKSVDLNIRGTCVYVFGLISKTEEGKAILERHGWESAPDLNVCVPKDTLFVQRDEPKIATTTTISVAPLLAPSLKSSSASLSTLAFSAPAAPTVAITPSPSSVATVAPASIFLKIEDYKFEGLWPNNCGDAPVVTSPPKDKLMAELLLYIGNLSNHITTENASKNIKRLKTNEPHLFRSKELMITILKLLEQYKFRLAVRQFIYSLIDVTSLKENDFALFTAPIKFA